MKGYYPFVCPFLEEFIINHIQEKLFSVIQRNTNTLDMPSKFFGRISILSIWACFITFPIPHSSNSKTTNSPSKISFHILLDIIITFYKTIFFNFVKIEMAKV